MIGQLGVAETFSDTSQCGDAYDGNNITMELLDNLARLETDPSLGPHITGTLFHDKMWAYFKNTKSSFFSYIYAGTVPNASASTAAIAGQQLAGFPPPPRVRVHVDLRNAPKYMPHQSGCTDQMNHNTAVDVSERPVGDFLWQRHPWGLVDGDPTQTEPGVDYLVAYWMGRFHAFLQDDAAGRCLA